MLALLLSGLSTLLIFINLLLWLIERKGVMLIANAIVLLALALVELVIGNGYIHTYFGLFSINPFSMLLAGMLTLGILLVNILAYGYAQSYKDFALLTCFATIGIYLVTFSASLLTIFVGLELTNISTLFIILLSKRQSMEAAVKFFMISALSIALLAFAIALVYGTNNTVALSAIGKGGFVALAAALFIASLGFGASLFPFNLFTTGIYDESPTYSVVMLSGINKAVCLIIILQVLFVLFFSFKSVFVITAVIAAVTMLYGGFMALTQKSLKRMIAYSSISEAGFILIGVAASSGSGLEASVFQIFAQVFVFIGIFSIVAWLEKMNKGTLDDLIGLSKENRFAAAAVTLLMLGLIGLPFTTGFVGRFLLLLSAINSGLVWLVFVGIMNCAITAFYYAKAITAIYTNKFGARHVNLDLGTVVVVLVCLTLTVVIGVYPGPFIGIVGNAANYLMQLQ